MPTKEEKEIDKDTKKTESYLIREYHDLIVIRKLLERYQSNREKGEERYRSAIERKIKREEKVERKFNKTLERFENDVMKHKESPTFQKIKPLLQQIDIFKNNLIKELSKGGALEENFKKQQNHHPRIKADIS